MAAPASPPAGSPGGAPEELPIDVDLIKVLASDSRRDILRLLGERRKTLTELAEALGLKKATVLEHLKKLQEASLIKRLDEDDRLWIYYELTPRGKRLVHPGRTRFYLIMAGSMAALVVLAAVVVASTMLGGPAVPSPATQDGDSAGAPVFAEDARATVPPVVWRGFDADVAVQLASTPGGSQLLVGDVASPVALVQAEGGRATLDARTIDALPTGKHALTLSTPGGMLALDAALDVRDPPVAFVPAAVPEGASTSVRLHLGEPGLPTPAVQSLAIADASIPVSADGVFTAPPLAPGQVEVRVGRLATGTLQVLPDLPVTTSWRDGQLVLASAPGTRALLDAEELGITNESGELVAPWPASGERALRLVAADGRAQERAIVVTNESISSLAPQLALNAFHGGGPQVLSLHVEVTNRGPANETVTLVASLRDRVVASTVVTAPGEGVATAALRAEVRADAPVTIEAYASRASAFVLMRDFRDTSSTAGSSPPAAPSQPPASSQPAATMPPTPTTTNAAKDTSTDGADELFLGTGPDARVTLAPLLVAPTGAVAANEGMTAEGAEVPDAGAALVVAVLALAALALTGRRGARRP